MNILRKHEIFEIETLQNLKNGGFLEPLVFCGGTMLRLCFELNRYSTDLDFWFIKKVGPKSYFRRLKKYLDRLYEVTDAQMKFYTLLFEIRSMGYPKRLKIEIRKGIRNCDFQEKIAFSKYSTKQVLLKVCTLPQMMKNKIDAALHRKDIRDCFDIEFLLRQGVGIESTHSRFIELRKLINSFKEKDYKVTLGSTLESDVRKYYIDNKLDYLIKKIDSATKSFAQV